MMATTLWYAVKTSGAFQAGRTYTKEQLGVLGRMAARAGYLVKVEQSTPKQRVTVAPARAIRPRSVARRGAGKDKGDGEAGL